MPAGKIPTLQHGELVMWESAAINTYLGDTLSKLVPPAGTASRGRYEQLIGTLVAELDSQCLWIWSKHEVLPQFRPEVWPAIPEAVEHAKIHFKNVIGVILQQLSESGGVYLLGEMFSAADILLVHCLQWATTIGWDTEWAENDTLVQEYLEACISRTAYTRAKALP